MKYLSISFFVFGAILLATPLLGKEEQFQKVARMEKLLKEIQGTPLALWPDPEKYQPVTETQREIYKV